MKNGPTPKVVAQCLVVVVSIRAADFRRSNNETKTIALIPVNGAAFQLNEIQKSIKR